MPLHESLIYILNNSSTTSSQYTVGAKHLNRFKKQPENLLRNNSLMAIEYKKLPSLSSTGSPWAANQQQLWEYPDQVELHLSE